MHRAGPQHPGGSVRSGERALARAPFTKRTTRQLGKLVDRSPNLAFLGLLATLVFAGIQAIRILTA
jgi:hypothetical protein